MSTDTERPILGISGEEAAEILGVSSRFYVYRLVSEGVIPRRSSMNARSALDRDDVERVALDRYRPGRPYWLTTPEVAELLGVTPTRVR